jgi:hypothetical protein
MTTRAERHDQWGARRRLVFYTDYSRLSPDTRAAIIDTGRRIIPAVVSLADAFRGLGVAFDRAGWSASDREHAR